MLVAIDKPVLGREEVEQLTAIVAQKIQSDRRWRPEAIVGIAPWLTVAHDLAMRLDVAHVSSIQLGREHPDGPVRVLSAPRWFGRLPYHVLLVGHVYEEGPFWAAAYQHLAVANASLVRRGALIACRRLPRPSNAGLYADARYPALDYYAQMRTDRPKFYWDAAR